MNLNTKIPCPNCGSKRNRQIAGNQLQCNKCNAVHDGKPNDFGRALHHNPERHLQKMAEMEREQREKTK
jgi:ribosomal protein L37AE/L43A